MLADLVGTDEAFERESAAFHRLLPTLLQTRPGLFVAVYGGQVIDEDADEFALRGASNARTVANSCLSDKLCMTNWTISCSRQRRGLHDFREARQEVRRDVSRIPRPLLSDRIVVSDLAGNKHPRLWSGLIDTGADVSVVPIEACDDLKLAPRDRRQPRGFDPEAPRRLIPRYYLCLGVEGVGEVPLLAYAVRRSYILIGQDFLKGLVLLLDRDADRWKLGRHGLVFRYRRGPFGSASGSLLSHAGGRSGDSDANYHGLTPWTRTAALVGRRAGR